VGESTYNTFQKDSSSTDANSLNNRKRRTLKGAARKTKNTMERQKKKGEKTDQETT
jgi:hypothetical protein